MKIALSQPTYLAWLGYFDLIDQVNVMADRAIAVAFQHYEHPESAQLFPPFQAYASVLDLLFNERERSLEVLRSGRRTPFTSLQVREQVQARPAS